LTERYKHRDSNGNAIELPLGKVVCVGRNYAAHARELNNPIPSAPLLFIKPATALVSLHEPLDIPAHQGVVHHEVEVALLIGRQLEYGCNHPVIEAIAGIGLALDLTLRDVQSQLKENGQPWEIAKGFDGACPCSGFVATTQFEDLQDIDFSLELNGQLQQVGNTGDMLFPIAELLVEMSRHFTLQAGDIVLTGTPAGVGPMTEGDQLRLTLADQLQLSAQVSA
jgi:2-keto-4-pentenoate hydratase/2-oxohepta-3-ene-1,7-dioic acid hydratase in catechol pathway